MKVGIVTFHAANNYGAVLQAYALEEVIRRMGFKDVEIVNYVPWYIRRRYGLIAFKTDNILNFTYTLTKSLFNLHGRISTRKKFEEFREKYLCLTPKIYKTFTDIPDVYDVCIVGSDQVWNFEITAGDRAFFLEFCGEKGIKASYAASMGKNSVTPGEEEMLKNGLSDFDYISVREDSSRVLLTKLLNRDILCVLDPTFLLNQRDWNDLLAKSCLDSPEHDTYLLLYRVANDQRLLKIAETISKEFDYAVLDLAPTLKSSISGFKQLKNIGPVEFLALVKNADFIVTNSYHGTIFSILYQKRFITVPHETRGVRIIDLLKRLHLEERLIYGTSNEFISSFFNINYSVVSKILLNEIDKSISFLKNVLTTG